MLVPALLVVATLQTTQLKPATITGGPPPAAPTTIEAARTDEAPTIDGRNTDAIWRTAAKMSGFRQFQPQVNGDPTFATEFQVAYDAHNMYVFVRMFDPHPDSIMHALSRRDVRGPSDQIKLIIDSYDDKRTGYELAVNPDGVKRDFSISNDTQEDQSWNGIWDVATLVDAEGWTAEFRIPLSQLRYGNRDTHTFGFGVWRDIERLTERTAWPEYSPNRAGLASQLGRLTGITGISNARHVELTPYALTRNQQRTISNGKFGRDQQLAVGADLKLGITPNITLDATINPDFGQVEADPAIVNLTAFEAFVSEQRPFFVEGTGLYQFQLNCYIVTDCGTNEGLFYSRRIGRSPALRSLYGDQKTPSSTQIAAAGKLTGRTQSGLSFGALGAFTPNVSGPQSRTVEPATNYSLLRAQQDLRGGEAGIGVIATAVNRSMDTLTDPYLHASAYATGISFRNRFYKKQYELAGQFTASQINGSALAIARTQRNSVHYYQQPNDDLSVDTTRTSLSGHAEQLKFGKYAGGITRFETSVVRQSAGFEVNDLGFLQRADVLDWSTWSALSFRNARGIYRWAQVNANHWERWNTSGARLDDAINLNGHMGLKNNWDVHLGGTLSGLRDSYCDRCTRGGPLLRTSRAFSPWGGINTDSRRTVSGGIWVNMSRRDEGTTTSESYSPYVNLRFSNRLQLNIGAGYSKSNNNTQWFGNFTDGGGTTHYAFAHLTQRTKSSNIRLNYTATPTLTFEMYAQPFVSTGTYSDIREISTTPEADTYADRFQSYTPPPTAQTKFRAAQLRTNSVARWEYRPGSTLFVVWAHGRADNDTRKIGQSWGDDYRDLFRLHPENTFLIKMSYWLNR